MSPPTWQQDVFTALKKHDVRQIAYVADGNHRAARRRGARWVLIRQRTS